MSNDVSVRRVGKGMFWDKCNVDSGGPEWLNVHAFMDWGRGSGVLLDIMCCEKNDMHRRER